MTITVSEFPNVRERLRSLGCAVPATFCALPVNFEKAEAIEDLRRAPDDASLRKLWRASGYPSDDPFSDGGRPPSVVQKSVEWVAPILFFANLAIENRALLEASFDVVSGLVLDRFGRRGGNVDLDVVAETDTQGTCKKLSYHGPVEGLKDLPVILREFLE